MFKNRFTVKKIDLTKNLQIKNTSRKLNFAFIFLITILFISLITYSFDLQVVNSSNYLYKSSSLNVVSEELQPPRGIFYDVNGNTLVENVQKYDAFIKKANYKDDDLNKIKASLKDQFNKNDNDINDLMKSLNDSAYDVKVASNFDSKTTYDLQNKLKDNNYFYFKSGFKRNYLYPKEFAHIIGYTGPVELGDVKNGYQPDDQIGKYKLEYQLEDQLKGVKGQNVYVGGVETKSESEPGDNVYLTIDASWQYWLYRILGEEVEYWQTAGGAGAIVDNTNGNVVALVGYPAFDSNLFVNGISNDQYKAYVDDRENPMLDKAIALQAAPGSAFKIVTAYTLLQNNIIDENTTYFSNRCLNEANFDFCEYHQLFYGQMNVVRALYKSSNLFFCSNMLTLHHNGELDKFGDAAKSFNIGEKTGINLVGEASGNMDSPQYRKDTLNLDWYEGDTCNAAIGQGSVLVTPLQMAMVASTVANKGVYYQPNIISKITDSAGNIVQQPQPIIKRTIPIDNKTLDLINEGMHDVAYYYDGTEYPFLNDVPGNIRAKTGTAEAYENLNGEEIYRTHGWIVGTFDYNGKSYSFAFQMNYGGGGFYVGKVLRKFVNCVYMNFEESCLSK